MVDLVMGRGEGYDDSQNHVRVLIKTVLKSVRMEIGG